MNQVRLLQSHVVPVLRTISSGSVHMVCTSPPYWGLRDYGIEPQVWGGEDCPGHEWGEEIKIPCGNAPSDKSTLTTNSGKGPKEGDKFHNSMAGAASTGAFCRHCGAWRGSYGLEPTIDLYVQHTVEIFREVRRVLRRDGICFLNLGDSYAANRSYQVPDSKHIDVGNARGMKAAEYGLKPKDLCGVPWRVALALQADGWWLRSDIIWHKCLSGGTRLYARTQKGEMPSTLKDLVRLDPATVQLWNGEAWTQVKSWTKSPRTGTEKEIVFRSGERVGCTLDHRWPTARGLIQARDLQIGDVVDVCALPEPEYPRTPKYLADDIGWFVGLYIAEGSQSDGTIQIASHAKEAARFNRLQHLAESFDGYVAVHQTSENGATANINSPVLLGIINTYVSGKTAKDKHLHIRCWKRSNGFLSSVLDGYLSGDGHWRENRWKVSFCANDNLAADLRTVCARLGLSIRLKRTQHICNGKKYPGWRGEIKDNHRNSGGEIIAIVPSRARIFWDVAVEGDPHLFSLASGILTHNSNPMPESVTDRPTTAHEHIFMLTKSGKYFWDAEAVREEVCGTAHARGKKDGSPPSMAFKMQEPGVGNRNNSSFQSYMKDLPPENGRNLRNVWTIATAPFPEAHFATFPPAIPERCIKAGTSEKGCCPKCGAGWRRVVEKGAAVARPDNPNPVIPYDAQSGMTHGTGATTLHKMRDCTTIGWVPTCTCSSPDLEIINTHVGNGSEDDPTILTGRKGMNRPRKDIEGIRPITRYEQREYAEQLKISVHREEMREVAGPAFDHYLRTDKSGARPIPQPLLDSWIAKGWLCKVEVPEAEPLEPIPCTVLDPFSGAGTTALVAAKLGRDAIGIELNPDYVEMSRKRIAGELGMLVEVAHD